MMRVIHVWLISIVFCFLWTFSCAAQVREKEGVLLITLESRQEVWDTSHPLEVDVKFENVGGRSEYIALKCGFGFQGNLTRSEGQSESLWYFIEWDNRSR